MPNDQTLDIGAVQMHKKVIGDIAAAALKEVPGVSLARFGIVASFFEAFGFRNFPGVHVTVDKDGQIILRMRVVIEYGLNIPTVASRIQEEVQRAVEKAVDIELKEIDISIQSVERRAA